MIYIFDCFIALMYVTWLFFLALMTLRTAQVKNTLTDVTKFFALPILLIGAVLDVSLNIVSSIPFLQLPTTWLLTTRLEKYISNPVDSWRKTVAIWLCHNLLDPAENGGHCHKLP